ncbi:MAG: hypothetical protein JXX28_01340 [Deltaproteobacteria bacterium]|nr:hypothetical protein [Deltaproteobacteria bacterium]
MYRCELCSVVIQPNSPALRVILETRPKVYAERQRANKVRIRGKRKPLHANDPGGRGWEIVRAAKVCRTCHDKWVQEHGTPGAESMALHVYDEPMMDEMQSEG